MKGILNDEVAAAEGRREAHWAKVGELKKQRDTIRQTLSTAKARYTERKERLEVAKKDHRHCTARWYCTCEWCEELRSGKQSCQATRQTICDAERRLRETTYVEPVRQPLPEDETKALQVLFFLYMPSPFRSLSHLSFQAQQMLLPPQEWDSSVEAAVEEQPHSTLWSAYYNKHQSGTYHTTATTRRAHDGAVMLGCSGEFGGAVAMVDLCTEPSDGVWHPDVLSPGFMLWQGGVFTGDQRDFYFDPFSTRIRPEWIVDGYTEQLPEEDRCLQWAMPQHGIGKTSPERGNLAIANQGDAPDWLSKQQHLAFGGVRAYPLTQLRQLILVLRERTLPLGHPAVRTLLSQALFHIGDLSNGAPTTLLWRHDQTDVFASLFDELKVSQRMVHSCQYYSTKLCSFRIMYVIPLQYL